MLLTAVGCLKALH